MKKSKEEEEFYCEDCGCEINYWQWLLRTGPTDNTGYCEECWEEFIESLFEVNTYL